MGDRLLRPKPGRKPADAGHRGKALKVVVQGIIVTLQVVTTNVGLKLLDADVLAEIERNVAEDGP